MTGNGHLARDTLENGTPTHGFGGRPTTLGRGGISGFTRASRAPPQRPKRRVPQSTYSIGQSRPGPARRLARNEKKKGAERDWASWTDNYRGRTTTPFQNGIHPFQNRGCRIPRVSSVQTAPGRSGRKRKKTARPRSGRGPLGPIITVVGRPPLSKPECPLLEPRKATTLTRIRHPGRTKWPFPHEDIDIPERNSSFSRRPRTSGHRTPVFLTGSAGQNTRSHDDPYQKATHLTRVCLCRSSQRSD